MGVSAYTGPVITFGQSPSSGTPPDYNPQAGPSLFYQGGGLIDPRYFYSYFPGQASSEPIYGFGSGSVMAILQTPSTALENSIALTQSATTATVRTLVLSSVDNANVTTGVSLVAPESGTTVTGLLAIDGATGTVTFGADSTVNLWNPATMIARTVRIEGSSDDSGEF